ncbi:hypothetical protein [Neobacillus terrae]|uniref:hypothetical protein n=1 Tax=Neobacillus terrae TaxID=3034837 RepID=UPI001407E7F3|nr:hypothetical protein [Neobacillus terrae]NHM31809.1 hypothetical protein [Neobacillus terrae]
MAKQVELSDYHLWMCQQIRERLAQSSHSLGISPLDAETYTEKDLVTIALSEMVVRLSSDQPFINGTI